MAGSFLNALLSTSDTTYDIIMFRTGGRLAHYWGDTSDSGHVLKHLYIAGQTAPGGGFIYTKRSPLGQELTEYGSDIVVRYLSGQKFDGRGIRMCGDRVILDHLSISRTGADPGASNTDALQTCQRDGTPEGRFGTFTVSNNLLGDAHTDGNSTTNMNGRLQTVARNYAFGVGRRMFNINSDTATVSGFRLANNVVYNWGGNGAYAGIFSTQVVGSYVYNYMKPGPATPSTPLYRNAPAHWQDLCGATAYPSGCDFSLQWEGNRTHINGYTTVSADTSWANGELRCRNSGTNEYTPDCASDDDLVPQAFRRNTDIWTHIGQEPYWPYLVREPLTDAYVDSIMADVGNSKMLNCDGTWSARRSTYDSTVVAQFAANTGASSAIDWDYTTHDDPDSIPVVAIPSAGTACGMVTSGQGTG
ncbi:MAG: hypothetical protein VW362_05170, partial [Candidatus Nanopelagicales bacterium]